ncbi:hypothetical protein [Allokutzneria sp. NRRL B-24872]|uniref:hypothetical protein n=1 Tax=Allokutzneria sp. NRRL B-24872 TaxID=1137961 RepID=UPI000A3913C7|nr:hypothetical protein [Allokutzneria sp. NRRL B-24872]
MTSSPSALLPVLRSVSQSCPQPSSLPFRPVIGGVLTATLAEVGTTSRDITHELVGTRCFDAMMASACDNLMETATYQRSEECGGAVLAVERPGGLAASVVASRYLRDLLAHALGPGPHLVALPCPDTFLATPVGSGMTCRLEWLMRSSGCGSAALTPSLIAVEDAGMRVVAERPAR